MSVIVKNSDPAACVASQVLLVSSRPDVSHLYSEVISQGGFGVTVKATCEDAIAWLRQEAAPLAVLDLSLAGMHGLELLRVAQSENFKTAIIAISRDSSLKLAVEAMKLGALDYLVEPFDTERLLSTLRQASPLSPALDGVTEQDETPRAVFQGFVGKSPAMREIYSIIEKAAASNAKVFITGESGTGKEVCAHAIHSCSPRRNKPFLAVNCAAIPRELMESEIFGHVKGAFTGAIANRTGAATEALGGTLFLDEICELSLDLQAKLLRLVNDGTFQCLGSSKVEKADIRLVCATNRDPRIEVKEGRFREDLFYRLHVIPIHLPPLRERGNDIMQIATYLLHDLSSQEGKHFRGFTPEAEALMRGHHWPGNVRELQNALYNAIALNNGVVVDEAMLPPSVGDDASRTGPARVTERADTIEAAEQKAPAKTVKDIKPLWLVEREAITEALEICGQNIPKAAAILEISVSTIYRKKLEYEALERSKAG